MRNGYPLVELHRHLDGNVRLETIIDLAKQHGLDLPAWTVDSLRPYAQVVGTTANLMAFIAKFDLARRVIADYDAVRRITRENVEDAAKEGIDYLELRFSPYFMAELHGLECMRVAETICHEVQECTPTLAVTTKLICVLSRTYGPKVAETELEAAVRHAAYGIVGIDLAGNEQDYPGDLFLDHFEKARTAGLRTVAHAGEAGDSESIRQAVVVLKAERIGHAVAARKDPALMELLAETGTVIESCPTSNLQTSTVRSYQEHPLPLFLRHGLRVTLNTDDPGISGITLAHEYAVAEQAMGLSAKETRLLQEHAVSAAFMTTCERSGLFAVKQQKA